MTKYPRQTVHEVSYYRSILLSLAEGYRDGLTQSQIVQRMNSIGLSAPTGNCWTIDGIKTAVRNVRDGKGPIYRAMLELAFKGEINRAQVQPLLRLA